MNRGAVIIAGGAFWILYHRSSPEQSFQGKGTTDLYGRWKTPKARKKYGISRQSPKTTSENVPSGGWSWGVKNDPPEKIEAQVFFVRTVRIFLT